MASPKAAATPTFMDEVAEMSLRMQAVLLRFLAPADLLPQVSGTRRSARSSRMSAAANSGMKPWMRPVSVTACPGCNTSATTS
jgi:transcriptional regulator with PAS, ATPase and Fis domain